MQDCERTRLICKQIVIMGPNESLSTVELESSEAIRFYGVQLPGSRSSLVENLSRDVLGVPVDDKSLALLQQDIQAHYQKNHHPLVFVSIPEQEITSGILQVRVAESAVGKIGVEGNRHTSSQLLKNYLGVNPGDSIDTRKLEKNLDFINRNPFRRVNLIYAPGQDQNTTDLSLMVEDRRFLRSYVGADNSGVETTDRGRFIAGVNSSKFLKFDHFLTYQYTSSWDFHHFQAHTLQYIALLSWKHLLNAYGGVSWVNAKLPAPSTRNNGASYQASGRYIIPITPWGALRHEWGFGFDFKRTNNNILFSELYPKFGQNVNLSQFIGHYAGNWHASRHLLDYNFELFGSPGAILGDESNAAYDKLRPFAKNYWIYAKGFVKYLYKFPAPLNMMCFIRGQVSSQNLLPSEQIGLGGFDSVRGYDERQLNYDSGLIVNFELSSAAFSAVSNLTRFKGWRDNLQFLMFLDYGLGANHNLLPGEKIFDYLLGAGPAVRYLIDPWLTARLDLGFKLHKNLSYTGGNAMWYFSLVTSY